MKNIIIILDPAHGLDVAGKRSPDGKHRECIWSREREASLKKKLVEKGYEVYYTTDSINEPGLSKRRIAANTIKHGQRKLLLSLHNDASGVTMEWRKAHGASVYTTKGVTNSDICADIIYKGLAKDFKGEVKMRKYTDKYLGRDFEQNFTVLMGSDYMGVLIEWLFQDNKEDVEKLKDPVINGRFEDSLVESIENINNYFKDE